MTDDEAEDPEERRRRMEAKQNAAILGTALGLGIGATMARTREEQEIQEQEEYNEYHVEWANV